MLLSETNILDVAKTTSPARLQEEIKLYVTRVIDDFIQKLRLYMIERLKNALGEYYIQKTREELKNPKLFPDTEKWDLGTLISVFHAYKEKVFQADFGGDLRSIIPILMQVKDMRNRRVHEISKHLPIFARQAYKLADDMCRFFELMTIEVPASFTSELRQYRR